MSKKISNERTYSDLEFEKLKGIVKEFAVSPLGESEIESLNPRSDTEAIKKELASVEECQELLQGPNRFQLGEMTDFEPLIQVAQEHPPLEASDFLEISNTLTVAGDAREDILDRPKEETPSSGNWQSGSTRSRLCRPRSSQR